MPDFARFVTGATKILPAATQIVDSYHAREHLHALAATLAFIVTDPPAWLAQRLEELDVPRDRRSTLTGW